MAVHSETYRLSNFEASFMPMGLHIMARYQCRLNPVTISNIVGEIIQPDRSDVPWYIYWNNDIFFCKYINVFCPALEVIIAAESSHDQAATSNCLL